MNSVSVLCLSRRNMFIQFHRNFFFAKFYSFLSCFFPLRRAINTSKINKLVQICFPIFQWNKKGKKTHKHTTRLLINLHKIKEIQYHFWHLSAFSCIWYEVDIVWLDQNLMGHFARKKKTKRRKEVSIQPLICQCSFFGNLIQWILSVG